jgi:2-polyprenyl-3-methyl-5-hydroxy-6-metoxy-1,4-benzoquinol methylase
LDVHNLLSLERVREEVHRLRISAEALAALGTAIELQIGNASITNPKLEDRVKEVVHVLDLDQDLITANKETLVALLAEIRSIFVEGEKLLYSSVINSGWTHSEEKILQTQGQASSIMVPMLKRTIIPQLEGLAARLEASSASFLDVGVGVGGISIAMARTWPALRVLGIDPWEPAIAIARKNTSSAGLSDRIELRLMSVEDLSEISQFDLVWFPAPFIPRDRISASLKRVNDAMRPGAWIVSGTLNRTDDPLTAALSDLHAIYWGGDPLLPSELETLLKNSGFGQVRLISGPVWAAAALVVACRPKS